MNATALSTASAAETAEAVEAGRLAALHRCSDQELLDRQEGHEIAAGMSNARASEIGDILKERHHTQAEDAFDAADKSSGEMTLDHPSNPNLKIKAKISKTVSWDGSKVEAFISWLMSPKATPEEIAAATVKGEPAPGGRGWGYDKIKQAFKITFSVPEKTYAALGLDEDMKARLDPARTIKFGDLSVQLVQIEGGQA